MKRGQAVPTQLRCECCQNLQTIHRRVSRQKEHGHVKHMYCYKCKEVTAHIETKNLFSFDGKELTYYK